MKQNKRGTDKNNIHEDNIIKPTKYCMKRWGGRRKNNREVNLFRVQCNICTTKLPCTINAS
jgi:hypothetical protein